MKWKSKLILFLLPVLLLAGCAREQTEPAAEPVIPAAETPAPVDCAVSLTELMSANRSTLLCGGDFPDWIELCNTGAEPVELEGYMLSDNESRPDKWYFPALRLEPGERVVILCTEQEQEGCLNCGFSLSSQGGDKLCFSAPNGYRLWTVELPSLEKDVSLCFADGESQVCAYPSPGQENSMEGHERFLAESDCPGALTINEAVLYNLNYWEQGHEYYDWAELKNSSDEPLALSDYYITDDMDEPMKCRLPERTLQPGELFVLFCSGDESLSTGKCFHAPFALDAEGDWLYLCDGEGNISDRVYIRETAYGGSLGRMEGESGFFLFAEPSPGEENENGYRQMAETPRSLTAQGVHEGIESLEIVLEGEGEIHYTTDGSLPTEGSPVYQGPLTADKTCIVRAVSLCEGKLQSPCASFSYIINEGHSLPVVSLVCDPDEMFGGLGVYKNLYPEQECDAAVVFFDGEEPLYTDCAVKLHGASSRKVWPKKSFKLIFRSRYGGDLEHDLFQTGEQVSSHSLVLRGGNAYSMLILKDELASSVANAVCPSALALDTRYCVLYINAEYYGVYAIREAYSTQYFAEKTGSTEESIDLDEVPFVGTEVSNILGYIIVNDMRDPENYARAAERLDMESFARWMALEAFFNNEDIGGNVRIVKGDGSGKYQLALYDFDIAMSYGPGWDHVFSQESTIGKAACSVLKSQEFRQTLLSCTAELYRNGLNETLVQEKLEEYAAQLDPEMARNGARWWESYETWQQGLEKLRGAFTAERTALWIDSLGSYTDTDEETLKQLFGEYK